MEPHTVFGHRNRNGRVVGRFLRAWKGLLKAWRPVMASMRHLNFLEVCVSQPMAPGEAVQYALGGCRHSRGARLRHVGLPHECVGATMSSHSSLLALEQTQAMQATTPRMGVPQSKGLAGDQCKPPTERHHGGSAIWCELIYAIPLCHEQRSAT